MNNEMEDFDFDQAVREQYAQVASGAAITNLSVDRLRYLESKPKDSQNGYPGRSGTNLEFVKTALSHWAANHLSAQRAEKAIKAGLKNPLHRPGL